MAYPTFIVEGITPAGKQTATLQAISPEVALMRGRDTLRERHGGPVRMATVRYAASDNRMGADDFADPNREGSDNS